MMSLVNEQERQALIAQWDEAVKAMARRDGAIAHLAERIADIKKVVAALDVEWQQQRDFFEREQTANRNIEVAIAEEERKVARLREVCITPLILVCYMHVSVRVWIYTCGVLTDLLLVCMVVCAGALYVVSWR